MKNNLKTLSMQDLLSLIAIGRDDLRRTEGHAADLRDTLIRIKQEIDSRGK